MTIHIDYCYRDTAETFGYIRIPKVLISCEPYCNISADAKIAYGLMIERTSLSRINQWIDDQDRVYITYTVDTLMQVLHRSRNKVIRILKELDTQHGCGLIERKHRGLGRPDTIYVRVIDEVSKKDSRRFQITTTSSPNYGSAQVSVLRPNYPNSNYSNSNYPDIIDDAMDYHTCIQLIHRNVDYVTLIAQHTPDKLADIDHMIDTIAQAICNHTDHIRINNMDMPHRDVQQRLLHINMHNINYVLDRISNPSTHINNLAAYTLTALYNAVSTGNNYD